MERSVLYAVLLCLDLFSTFVLVLILFSSIFEKDKTPLLRIYNGMVGACTVSLLFEAASVLLFFSDYARVDSLRTILHNFAIIGGYGLSFSYVCYVANLVGPRRKVCQWALSGLRITSVIATIFLFVGGGFGLFFTFEKGATTPAQFFVFLFAFDIIACLAGIVLIVVYARNLNTKYVIALLTLPVFIFISATVQYLSFQMMYGLFAMAGMALYIIYLMIQTERNHRSVEQEKKLMDLNIAMMRSQIQPHFLYNALSSIRRMIKKDPEVAETAIEKFSLYLRQNLESMSRVEPIPFATELQHVQEYLYLEKLRFGERLQVKYEIGYSDFMLPVLTLQPIVENAVKHGVLAKEEGGCIWIKILRDGGNVILCVEDDGVGFDPGRIIQTGRTPIGFQNVKSRIEMQCKGKVSIDSTVGVGTIVTITIPLM